MDNITFSEMVSNLCKSPEDILKEMSNDSAHLLHMAVGVSGEAGELAENIATGGSLENLIEECGDVEFYLEGLCQGIDWVVPKGRSNISGANDRLIGYALFLNIHAAEVLDIVKKAAIYNKPLDVDALKEAIQRVTCAMAGIYAYGGVVREYAIQANTEKLLLNDNARYKEGSYSNKAAQERSDKVDDSDETDSTITGDEDETEALDSESEQLSEHSLPDTEQDESDVQGDDGSPD